MKKLIFSLLFALVLTGCQTTQPETPDETIKPGALEGHYLLANENEHFIITPDGPHRITQWTDNISFADLTDGDIVRTEVMLVQETWPAQIQIDNLTKISDGQPEDIDRDILAGLAEMGWYCAIPLTYSLTLPLRSMDFTEGGQGLSEEGEGKVTVTFPFTAEEAEAYGNISAAVFTVLGEASPTALYNQFHWGAAGVYPITTVEKRQEIHPIYHFFHGMSEQYIDIYGEEADQNFRERREYMYLIDLEDGRWLALTFYLPEDLPALGEVERDFIDFQVTNIRVSSTI